MKRKLSAAGHPHITRTTDHDYKFVAIAVYTGAGALANISTQTFRDEGVRNWAWINRENGKFRDQYKEITETTLEDYLAARRVRVEAEVRERAHGRTEAIGWSTRRELALRALDKAAPGNWTDHQVVPVAE